MTAAPTVLEILVIEVVVYSNPEVAHRCLSCVTSVCIPLDVPSYRFLKGAVTCLYTCCPALFERSRMSSLEINAGVSANTTVGAATIGDGISESESSDESMLANAEDDRRKDLPALVVDVIFTFC